jgi:hypothetical protein
VSDDSNGAADDQQDTVISCQKVRSFAIRSAGSFPAMMAVLMAPMETPATQSGSMFASARAS